MHESSGTTASNTNLTLFSYEGAELRTVTIDGEPWFVAPDACRMLTLANPTVALRMVDTDDQKRIPRSDTLNFPQGMAPQVQMVTVVNESGMWALVLQSNKEQAAKVRRWLTRTVLPSIRKTGTYHTDLDLSDPLDAIEAANTRTQQAVEIARVERARAEKAETKLEVEQRHRRAIEGGDGILLGDFGKKYFSEVRHTDFWEHLYRKNWLIDQRGTRVRHNGETRDGHDHKKPTYKGRPFIYEHDTGNHGGKRRFQPRVRPQRELDLRDALAAEGLPVNTHSTGLVLVTSTEMKELGA